MKIIPDSLSYTEKKAKHIPSGYTVFTNSSFDKTKNKHDYYRGKDCMEKLPKDFREPAMKTINYEEKEMILLTDKETKSYEKQKVCHICKKEFCTDKNYKKAFKLYHKVRDHCHYSIVRKFRRKKISRIRPFS